MSKKVLISLSGYSTAGKSYIMEYIMKNLPDIYVIPQATIRPKREDDNIKLIKSMNTSSYNNEKFLVEHNGYGILLKDYKKFINSSQKIGIVILGITEIEQLKMLNLNIKYLNTFIKFSDDLKLEKQIILNRITKLRGSKLSRIKYNIKLANSYKSLVSKKIIDYSFISNDLLLKKYKKFINSL